MDSLVFCVGDKLLTSIPGVGIHCIVFVVGTAPTARLFCSFIYKDW